jgi:hypothetical protein
MTFQAKENMKAQILYGHFSFPANLARPVSHQHERALTRNSARRRRTRRQRGDLQEGEEGQMLRTEESSV